MTPGLPAPAEAFAWVRDQLIGEGTPLVTPFGERRLIYADYVASGRSLRWVEETLTEQIGRASCRERV